MQEFFKRKCFAQLFSSYIQFGFVIFWQKDIDEKSKPVDAIDPRSLKWIVICMSKDKIYHDMYII